ncbi:hypothetical protein B0H19DRAFT_1274024 [Mycena capillaripes]|nr:hypothetical protein B0H19DRAFT_1274024 [Mycena capillaripes]
MSIVLAFGLIEGVLELTLYGVFAVLFFTVVYLFSIRGLISRKRPSFFVFLALICLFLAITAHWVNVIYVLYLVFINLGGSLAADIFYLTLSTPSGLINMSLVGVVNLITDSLMIHRLYVVWTYDRRVVIFPIFVLACQIASGVLILYALSRETVLNFYVLSNPAVFINLISSLVISAYSTGMIIFKIWRTSRSIRVITGSTSAGKNLRRAVGIMVESAVLQTTMTICILVSFQTGLLAEGLLNALQPVVSGISVLLIHVRVGLGWTADANASELTPTNITLNLTAAQRGSQYEVDLESGK